VKKGIFFIFVVFAAIISLGTSAFAIEIFFEHRDADVLSRGIIYEQNRMMTSRGMLDVHVLIVDLDEPYITLAPVASSRELGLRETTSRMLSDAGAVAGINADFFSMSRNHSTYFGPMVRDGQVLSLNAGTNIESHDLATFFLDMNNNPFFRYMRTTMRLYANGSFLTNIITYNSIGPSMYSPMIVSRAAMEDTAAIDARIPDTTKIVVENNIVTRVTTLTVDTPENGFVILIPAVSLPYYGSSLTLGTHVNLHVGTDLNVDFSGIRSAIGGGAVILENGELVEDVGIEPNRRHPRTAVGVTRDGRIILMTVDGRTHSIGVTHAELGAILQRYGVINAMHMDGGGSTTMVTRTVNGAYSVANLPSDGSQRRVTNALGIFDNSPIGEPVGIVLEPAETRAVQGVPLPASVFGVDSWGNRIPLGEELIGTEPVFLANPIDGFWNEGQYTPLRTGTHQLEVRYGAFQATAAIEVFSLGELQPHHEIISLLEGGRVRLQFAGIALDGTQVNIPEVTGLTVSPEYLGTFENGYFIATRGGSGYITAEVGAVRAYIPVTVGGFPWPIDMFGGSHLDFLSTPAEYVSTHVTTETVGALDVIRLDYSFGITSQTQASHVTFYPALQIPGEPIALRMQVFSDDSGHWLRGRVRDGNGTFHNIDFSREVNFTGWETVIASLPNTSGPFTIDRIYMVALESLEQSRHMAIFSDLEALYAPNHNIPVPRGTIFQDRLRADRGFTGVAGGGHHVFEIPCAEEETAYSILGVSNFAVATMAASKGGIQATAMDQWRYFMPNIRALNLPYVVILLDENPLNFTHRMEFELFHLAMTQLRDEGRTVFVVSATDEETVLTMRDNIRYINVTQRENASIRFWTDNDRVWWSD